MDEPADVATAAAADLAALTGGTAPVMFDIGAADRRHVRAASASDVELLAHIAEGRRLDREISAAVEARDMGELRDASEGHERAFAAALGTIPQTREGFREVLTWIQRRCEAVPLSHALLRSFLRSALASPLLSGA